MNIRSKQSDRVRRPSRDAIAVAVATIIAGAGSTAFAAAAPADDLEEVVVTGIRHAIETAVATKKQSDSIVESISAEDIGKLPDTSIADSISRLPGLAAQRVNGRASVISIRGLAPRYGATLLNGREMVSTGDNRSVEYDQFPSELINSATVYKTPDGTLIGQGLSGTLNMQTVRPLDVHGRQAAINARGNWNSNGQLNADTTDKGGRFSASYVNQYLDNTLGVALGYAYLNTPNQEKHYKSWWWADQGVWGSAGHLQGTPAGSVALQGFEAGAASTQQIRQGLMSVIEYKPTEDLTTMVDLYYSNFNQTENRRTLMSDFAPWNGTVVTNATTTPYEGNVMWTGGNLSGVKPVDLSTLNKRHDGIFSAGWNTQLKTGEWTSVLDLSYSSAVRHEQDAELSGGALGTVSLNNISINLTNTGRTVLTPSIDYTNPAQNLLGDPEGWGRDGRSQFPHVKDEIKSIRLGSGRDFNSFFSHLDFGANYSVRTKDMNRTEVYYNLLNNRAPVAVSSDLLLSPTGLSFGGIPTGVLAYNFYGVLGKYYSSAVPVALDQAPGRIWNIDEKITTVFSKLSLHSEGRIPVGGNIGLQVVHANQTSTGIDWVPTVGTVAAHPANISGGASYTDILPSLNLNFRFPADIIARLGFAKTLARPNMEDMRAGFSGISVSDGSNGGPKAWSGNGGNPGLEPWRADAYDFSLEKYFGKRSYVSAAYFYKNLKNFVYTQNIAFDFTGFPNPTNNVPVSNIGRLNTLANGHGGLVAGAELAISLDLGLFTPVLDGFGMQLNGSDTRSSLHEENNLNKPLDGLSGQVTNVTAFYEKYGFSARVSQRHRSRFVTTVRGTFGDNVPSSIEAESVIDLQLGYAFETGAAKGLSVLFQVNNAKDEPYRTRVGIASGSPDPNTTLPERYTTYGREFLLGVNYKFN
jgi:iron complex outermembrane receptor protein